MTGLLVALALTAQVGRCEAAACGTGSAQFGPDRFDVGGDVTFMVDGLTRLDVYEFRPRVRLDLTADPVEAVRLYAEVLGEGLYAERETDRVTGGQLRVREAWAEVRAQAADLRVGYGRLVWGRLDEVQPSDVINPLDATQFLLDSRAEARRPVAFARGRVYFGNRGSVEVVLVPRFEHSVFDELEEDSSPFNLVRDLVLPAGTGLSSTSVTRVEPEVRLSDPEWGTRLSLTAGRVDASVSVFRGYENDGLVAFVPDAGGPIGPTVVGQLVQTYPSFTMVAADFETVLGDWAIRGESAWFRDKTFLAVSRFGTAAGSSLDAGIGVERSAGSSRLFLAVLVHQDRSDDDPAVDDTSYTLVGSIDQRFGRDRHLVRVFGVADPEAESAFVRGLWEWGVRDNLDFEVSAGAFLGEGGNQLFQFGDRDFVLGRLRLYF